MPHRGWQTPSGVSMQYACCKSSCRLSQPGVAKPHVAATLERNFLGVGVGMFAQQNSYRVYLAWVSCRRLYCSCPSVCSNSRSVCRSSPLAHHDRNMMLFSFFLGVGMGVEEWGGEFNEGFQQCKLYQHVSMIFCKSL